MFEQAFKNIDDVLWKEAGCTTELDYTEQTSWLLFLKYLDGFEQDRADEAALSGKKYAYLLTAPFRWESWASPKKADGTLDDNKVLSGPDLIDFVNTKLFPYLQGFKAKASGPQTLEYKIGEIFGELKNRISSGYNLREIIDQIDGLRFRSQAEKHELSHLYEAKIKNMGINIGSQELIDKRSRKGVPIPPGGTLSDYVPFYFTPFSIMMYNIHTGYGGITRRENQDIVIFVSSLHRVKELGLPFVFTDQHAYAAGTDYYSDLADLPKVDWQLLQSRNFKTDDADPGKQLRYQAEALVHRHVPLEALLGMGCHSAAARQKLESLIAGSGRKLTVQTTPTWYF